MANGTLFLRSCGTCLARAAMPRQCRFTSGQHSRCKCNLVLCSCTRLRIASQISDGQLLAIVAQNIRVHAFPPIDRGLSDIPFTVERIAFGVGNVHHSIRSGCSSCCRYFIIKSCLCLFFVCLGGEAGKGVASRLSCAELAASTGGSSWHAARQWSLPTFHATYPDTWQSRKR